MKQAFRHSASWWLLFGQYTGLLSIPPQTGPCKSFMADNRWAMKDARRAKKPSPVYYPEEGEEAWMELFYIACIESSCARMRFLNAGEQSIAVGVQIGKGTLGNA